MKFKLFIIISAICIQGFIQKPSVLTHIPQNVENSEDIISFWLNEHDNSENRYVDYNFASFSQTDRASNPYRNTSNNLTVKNLNNSKRNYNSDSYITSSGKIIFISGTSFEVGSLKLHPSGFLSDRSFFISLRKFFV